MTLTALIRKREAAKPANDNPAKVAKNGGAKGQPLAGLAALALANPQESETDTLPDLAAEERRQRVLAMLAERPGVRYGVITDTQADPDAVILASAIRGQATCELRIPREKFDGVLLLDLVEKAGRLVVAGGSVTPFR